MLRIFYNSTMALVMKSVTIVEGVSKIIQICVTSFMDDPLSMFGSKKVTNYKFLLLWTRVELLPTFKFTGKTVKKSEFTDNYR